jgi:hypothetical protein
MAASPPALAARASSGVRDDIAGILRAPAANNPVNDPANARERRDVVLLEDLVLHDVAPVARRVPD